MMALKRAAWWALLAPILLVLAPVPGRDTWAGPRPHPATLPAFIDDDDPPEGDDPADEGEGDGGKGKDAKKEKGDGKEKKPAGKDGKDGKAGKDKKEGKDEPDESEPGEEGLSDEGGGDLDRPAADELDRAIPRFVGKEPPSFVVVRPGANEKTKKTAAPKPQKGGGKEAAVDGSRWGFVDFTARKKRISAKWDRLAAQREKVIADEKADQEDRERAQTELPRIKALKNKALKEIDKTRFQAELVGSPETVFKVRDQDRPAGLGEKNIRDQLRRILESQRFTITSERAETWRGKRIPGYTFIAEGSRGDWFRQTIFIVPKGKTGTSIIYFECSAPKAKLDDQLEKEFELFIRGTIMNG